MAVWPSSNALDPINEVILRAGKLSRYITATEVDLAFYPPWDGKMSISIRTEH